MLQSPRRNFSRAVCAWLCCLVGVLLPFVTFAKSSSARRDYLIDVWTTEKGLPDSSVTSIAQTPDGYLWVGTYKGLARFDGARFVTFDPENTPELQQARIRKLFLDAQGTLWINTYDGSLTSWRNGGFKLEWSSKEYADYDVARAGSKADHVTFVLPTGELIRRDFGVTNADWRVIQPPTNGLGTLACEDAEGTLWCRGRDSQLWRMTGGQFELITTNQGLPEGTSVRTIATDTRGRLWVGTDRGVLAWANGRIENLTPKGDEAVDANYLFHARDGSAWAVANGKLRKFNEGQWVKDVEPWEESLSGAMVMRLGAHEQADGTTWFYQYGLGLVCVMTDGTTHRFTAEEGFPNDRVDCFFEDQEGNLWAGVNRGGLVRLRKQRFQVISVGEGAQSAVMQTVCEDASGAMWLGTVGNGLARWKDGKLSDISLPGESGKGNPRGFVFSAYPGTQGELWLSIGGLSIGDENLYVMANGRIERCGPWEVHGVKAILASRDERTVWAGTKIGLFVCTNRATRSFAPYPGFRRSVDVRALAESADGTLWVGGGDGNLYRVATNGIEILSPKTRYPIWSLLLDKDGTVWAGTFRGGLLRYRQEGFRRFSVANGLPDSVIAQLLSDDKGNLWMGSHQGIFRVARTELDAYIKGNRTTIASTVYGRLDGLPSLECSGSYQPACWRARDGRLWFTTAAGVVAIQPGDATPNVLPPPVAIEEVLIDVKQQDLKSLGRQPSLVDLGRGRQRELLPVLEVPPGKRQFEFRFTGLSFVSPDKVRFRYKLIGLEKEWVEAGSRRSAQYSFLRPGEYQFQVEACNNEGVWNNVGSGLILRLQPHFYETKTFLFLAIVWSVGMILLFARAVYRRRLRAAMERVERQRAVERDRARIAKDIHDDLGAGLTQITLLSELAKRDSPEEVEGHVGQISGTARELTRAMDEIVWAINPQNDTLEGLITYVSKFAQQYLTVAGMRCRLDVPTHLPACVLGAEVRHNLYLAIKEALNNVVKHSQATVASLRLEYAHGTITLTIEDDGCGLVRSAKDPRAASHRTSSGHGLVNMKRRLEDIGGRCDVSGQPEGGTKVQFTIKVPVGGSPVLATGPTD